MSLKKKFSLLTKLGIILLIFGSSVDYSFSQGAQSSRPNKLQFEYDPTMGNIFYIDILGMESSLQLFAPGTVINPNEYILGTNDLLGVVISGTITLNYRALGVNAEGEVIIPSVGTIKVGGLSLNDARSVIEDAVQRKYRNVQVAVSIDKPRPLAIYISGDIPYPGRVSVPYGTRLDVPLLRSIFEYRGPEQEVSTGTSLTKILYPSFSEFPGMNERAEDYGNGVIAKPVTSVGKLLRDRNYQLRSVEIRRADGSVVNADMFHYFYGGDTESNPVLLNGDHIVITKTKEADSEVSISGAVNFSLSLPHRHDDTIEKLLTIAGGFSSNADTNYVILMRPGIASIERIEVKKDSDEFRSMKVYPFDRIIVPSRPIDDRLYSATVVGQVGNVGIYPIREGTTTAYDLIQMAGGTIPDALSKGAYIKRNKESVQDHPSLDNTMFRDLMRGSDQMIQGLSWLELEQRARKNRIFLDLNDQNQLKRITLMDGDSLVVPRDLKSIYVYGQVAKPGFLNYQSGLSYDEYIAQSGGLALSSNPKKVYVIKAGSLAWIEASEAIIESGDMIYVDRVMLDDNIQRRAFIRQSQSLYTSIVLSLVTTTLTVISFFRN